MPPGKPLIIAIDGPAASGKGTLARRLAVHFGLNHLDTGLTYRAVAHALTKDSLPLDQVELAMRAARKIDLEALDRSILSSHEIGEAASRIAVMPQVRRILVEKQRLFAKKPPGAVLDGRDIGTVVCPDASVKLYVMASAEIRARRRLDEMSLLGSEAIYADILAEITRRDERDTNRADSPLRPARDAHLIDTSQMGIEAAFQVALSIVNKQVSPGIS